MLLEPAHVESETPLRLASSARLVDFDNVTQIRLEDQSNTANVFLTNCKLQA